MAKETDYRSNPLAEASRILNDSWDEAGRKISDKVHQSLYKVEDQKNKIGRVIIARTLLHPRLLPTEVTAYQDAITEAHQMKENGYSFIVPYNHSNKREPLDTMTTLVSLGGEFLETEYLSPLAMHQRKADVSTLSALTGIQLVDIVTSDTLLQGKNFHKPTFKDNLKHSLLRKEQDHEFLSEGTGLREYVDLGGDILSRQGVVFVAPQGGRRHELGQPKGRAVEMLIRDAKRKGAEQIAIWPMGIILKDAEAFDETTAGLNLGKTAEVKFGIPMTYEETQTLRNEYNHEHDTALNLDQYIFTELAQLLPEAYTKVKE